MKNSSLYLGVVVTAEDDDGIASVVYHDHGPDYHGLTDADVVSMENVLMPLAVEYNNLALKANEILLKAGFKKVGLDANKPGVSDKPVR